MPNLYIFKHELDYIRLWISLTFEWFLWQHLKSNTTQPTSLFGQLFALEEGYRLIKYWLFIVHGVRFPLGQLAIHCFLSSRFW